MAVKQKNQKTRYYKPEQPNKLTQPRMKTNLGEERTSLSRSHSTHLRPSKEERSNFQPQNCVNNKQKSLCYNVGTSILCDVSEQPSVKCRFETSRKKNLGIATVTLSPEHSPATFVVVSEESDGLYATIQKDLRC
jgi:hypothetical protein